MLSYLDDGHYLSVLLTLIAVDYKTGYKTGLHPGSCKTRKDKLERSNSNLSRKCNWNLHGCPNQSQRVRIVEHIYRRNLNIKSKQLNSYLALGFGLSYLKFDGVYKLSTRITLIPSGILYKPTE